MQNSLFICWWISWKRGMPIARCWWLHWKRSRSHCWWCSVFWYLSYYPIIHTNPFFEFCRIVGSLIIFIKDHILQFFKLCIRQKTNFNEFDRIYLDLYLCVNHRDIFSFVKYFVYFVFHAIIWRCTLNELVQMSLFINIL